jgi:DNA-binding transcriptional ArsR family regulator
MTGKARLMDSAVEERVQQQAIYQAPAYLFAREQGILSGRPRGAELLEELMQHLLSGPADSATPLDFSRVSFIDVSCADEMLNKLLLRLASGEIGHRYVYIAGVNISVRETITAVLHLRELAALYKNGAHVEVLGVIKTPMREVLDVLLAHKCATSAEISDALGKNINIVCNRLNALQRLGLVCRLRDGSVAGGGRQFYYVSIV